MSAPPAQTSSSPLLRWLPGLAMLRGYRREWLPADLLAGVTVCVVMIPSVIAYAQLMGLPPQHGLYAALVPLLRLPVLRQLAAGDCRAGHRDCRCWWRARLRRWRGGDPARAAVLAAAVAVLSGLLLLLGARAKIGGIADFLSKPVLVGYMTGAALILVASQLDKLFGVQLEHNDFFPRLAELAGKLHLAHGPTSDLRPRPAGGDPRLAPGRPEDCRRRWWWWLPRSPPRWRWGLKTAAWRWSAPFHGDCPLGAAGR